jgi:hypothetical protein
MSFAPYLYFSFVLVSIYSILEVTKNFKHSLLLKIQFIGLLTFASVVNLFLFKGTLPEVQLSIVRLFIDLLPMFVLNIALIIYAYKIPIWIFIAELSICTIGGILIAFFNTPTPTNYVHVDTFHFYSIASTSNNYLKAFRILLLSGYFLFFIVFIVKTIFFEQQKNQFFKPLRFWITLMILGFVLYIFENALPIHVYTKGVYSTHVLPIYLMLGILYRPQSINAAWYQFDDLSSINKVEISKDNFEIAFYASHFYLKEKASIENLSVDLDSNKIIVTAFIKKNTGLGFADLINKSRVDYLVELLREGKHEDYTIEALAKMSGFGSRQTMYKAFAKFRNQSPTDFIDSLKH